MTRAVDIRSHYTARRDHVGHDGIAAVGILMEIMRQCLRIVDEDLDRETVLSERFPPGSFERREHDDQIDIRKGGAFAAHDGTRRIGKSSPNIAAGDTAAGSGQSPLRKNIFLDIVHDLVLECGRGREQKPARHRRVGLSSYERNSVQASTTHRGAVVVDVIEIAKILLMTKVNPRL